MLHEFVVIDPVDQSALRTQVVTVTCMTFNSVQFMGNVLSLKNKDISPSFGCVLSNSIFTLPGGLYFVIFGFPDNLGALNTYW